MLWSYWTIICIIILSMLIFDVIIYACIVMGCGVTTQPVLVLK